MQKYNIHIYENNIIPLEEIKKRHPFQIVVLLNYKSTFFKKNIKGHTTINKASIFWGDNKTEKFNHFTFKNSNGFLYIRLPIKSFEDLDKLKIHKISARQLNKIVERIMKPDHSVFYVHNDIEDKQKDIIEENEALTLQTDYKYRNERLNQYAEDTRINQLTPEQISQAKFSLGEKEYERRINEGIPIIF